MSTTQQPEVIDDRHPGRRHRGQEFMEQEGVTPSRAGCG